MKEVWAAFRDIPTGVSALIWFFMGALCLIVAVVARSGVLLGIGFLFSVPPLLWIGAMAWRDVWRHKNLRKNLAITLGNPAADQELRGFPQIPFWTVGDMLFYPVRASGVDPVEIDRSRTARRASKLKRGETIEAQSVIEILWAYGELDNGECAHQIVLWGRNARAAVVRVRADHMNAALDYLRVIRPRIVIGFGERLKESWNNDHLELIQFLENVRQADLALDPGWVTTDRIRTESAKKAAYKLYKSQADWEGLEDRRAMIARWETDKMAGAQPRRPDASVTDS